MNASQSAKSVPLVKSSKSAYDMGAERKIKEIDEWISIACQKFNCPYSVVVNKGLQQDELYKTMKKPEPFAKYKKITVASNIAQLPRLDSEINLPSICSGPSKQTLDEDTIVVTTYYDNMNRLVELAMANLKQLPRMLVQILGLLAPYYFHLNKITIKKCRINKYTIYELTRMLPLSTITDICLDGSYILEGNYAILLDGEWNLRSLSLSRCMINDDICKQIFAKLHYLGPSEASLGVLNLSSNHITHVGAKYIGEALRTNRHLRYLNLADNRISDDGARHIFDVLIEFPLTYGEILAKRRRRSEYLRTKQALYAKYMSEIDSASADEYSYMGKKPAKKKTKSKLGNKITKNGSFSDDYWYARAEILTSELMGPFIDPFAPNFTQFKDSHSHSIGNLILCYLNLSYNHLSYLSLKRLYEIILYQQSHRIKYNQGGLIKVLIEGNCIPAKCKELVSINDMLQKNVGSFGSRPAGEKYARRKSTRI